MKVIDKKLFHRMFSFKALTKRPTTKKFDTNNKKRYTEEKN